MSKRTTPASVEDALRMAISAHQRGKHDEAERRYRAVLASAPKHPDALHYLGVLLHQLGQREAALALIERALAIVPDYIDARNNLGNVQKELGLTPQAEQSYRRVIAARPDFAAAHNNLGLIYKTQQRFQEATDAFRCCVALAPEMSEGWLNLGNALVASERYEEALAVYRQWQIQAPEDTAISHMIAALTDSPAPDRASDNYVQSTFDRFADTFDEVLEGLDYRAPALCDALVANLLGAPKGNCAVLDAGCGTGLCAPFLLPYAHTLDGVDLSPKMLEKAALRNCYRHLYEAELGAWLEAHPASYELIVSADTLCYFGALEQVVSAAAAALLPGGYFVFTLEETMDTARASKFKLNPHGRYSHTEVYAMQILEKAGLDVVTVQRTVLRSELSLPVAGLAVAAQRR
jgi:predicted TPR repeat methyltransferase